MEISEENLTLYSVFYEESLYKLQNGVLNIVKNLNVPFYLTGGTALSRGYYNHRYSDDLDFFLNHDSNFDSYVSSVLEELKTKGFYWSNEIGFVKSMDFYSLIVQHSDFCTKLKLDFVNDIVAHFGDIQNTDVYYRTDSIRNILSNKITAIFRMSAKDVVDIREICIHEKFDWNEIFTEVREKELGIEPLEVVEILKGIPKIAFNSIKWIQTTDYETFMCDIEIIARDMLGLTFNSLVK